MRLVLHPCQTQEKEKRGMKIKHHCLLTTSVFLYIIIYTIHQILVEGSLWVSFHVQQDLARMTHKHPQWEGSVETFFRRASVSSTYPDTFVRRSVCDFHFLRPHKVSRWHRGGRHGGWHGGAHAGRQKDRRKKVANMELNMVADMEVDKVADMVADIKKNWQRHQH